MISPAFRTRLIAALIGGVGTGVLAQPVSPPSTARPLAESVAVIEALADKLSERFVFPEVGNRYATALRQRSRLGAYNVFATPAAFAQAVTDDLQAIHPDGHLRVMAPEIQPGPTAGSSQADPVVGLQKATWIAPGIAYLSFGMFPGDAATLAALRRFLRDHASAKTLIIDVRTHRGGGLAEMDVMFPHLYARRTRLLQMDMRRSVDEAGGNVFFEGPTVIRIDGPADVVRREHVAVPSAGSTGLRDAKIYLLTAARSASAAEHLALALKRTGRATLIGEVTAGAGHISPRVGLGAGYSALIPVGRTFDPDTGRGWEGVGIGPHVEVPAERALVAALVRSGVRADEAERLSAAFRPAGSMERRRPLRASGPKTGCMKGTTPL